MGYSSKKTLTSCGPSVLDVQFPEPWANQTAAHYKLPSLLESVRAAEYGLPHLPMTILKAVQTDPGG